MRFTLRIRERRCRDGGCQECGVSACWFEMLTRLGWRKGQAATEATKPAVRSPEDKQLAEELVEHARDEGVNLVGPGGLLTGLTTSVLEAGLEAEMSEHLGYDKHDPAGRERGSNSRNGTRSKTVLTDVGPVAIEVPRERDGSFEPQIVKKRQRRLAGVDEMVISLTAKGLTTGEVSAHMAEVYGAEVSKDTISRITDRILAEMSDWQNRPLDRVYPVIFIDAMVVKTPASGRSRTVWCTPPSGSPSMVSGTFWDCGSATAVRRQVLAPGPHRDPRTAASKTSASSYATGSRGSPKRSGTCGRRRRSRPVCCICIGNTFRFASKADWDTIARDLRPAYTAVSEHDATERFCEFAETCGDTYPAIIRLWENAWSEFVPFLDYSPEIRKVIYSTNAVESLNARMRRAARARGHFPTEQAALKCLYLVVRSLDPTGRGRKRWMNRWKAALNAFAITFEGRILPTDR